MSRCRRCGKCCIPNPIFPNHPGIMVLKEDLIRISKHTNYSLKYLNTKTFLNKDPYFAQQRYLPLPCMFYNQKRQECQIYEIRPFICKTYPISDVENQDGITVDVRCDYGKDIFRKAINYLKSESITSAIDNIELL